MNDFQWEDLPNRRESDEVFTLMCFKKKKKSFVFLVFVWSSFALNF